MLVNRKLNVKETCLFFFPKNSFDKGYFINFRKDLKTLIATRLCLILCNRVFTWSGRNCKNENEYMIQRNRSKIENKITCKIKSRYHCELLTSENMHLLGSFE